MVSDPIIFQIHNITFIIDYVVFLRRLVRHQFWENEDVRFNFEEYLVKIIVKPIQMLFHFL